MVGILLIIQVPDASDKGSVTLRFRPIDRFFLSLESAELVICVVFDYIILNGRPFRAALGTGFNVNVRHSLFSLTFLSQHLNTKVGPWLSGSTQHTYFIVTFATILLHLQAGKVGIVQR